MTPSSALNFGDVILLKFPFTNQAAFKQRPCVVVSSEDYNSSKPDVVVMAITSQIRENAGFGEAAIAHWEAAGLLKPSVIKPVFATIERGLVLKALGRLEADDRQRLKAAIHLILG